MTTLPHGRPLTRHDLETMPDDGHRYELIDGALVVSPAPSWLHQRVVTRVWRLLAEVCPAGLEVFVAPLDVVLAEDTVVMPDVLVARRSDLGVRDLPAPPVLAVEVLSPSTARIDHWLKRSRYEAASVPAYWIIDPLAPSLTAWNLIESRYVEVGQTIDDETFVARQPFAVSVTPSDLVSG